MNIPIHISWHNCVRVSRRYILGGIIPTTKGMGSFNLYVCYQVDTNEVHVYPLSTNTCFCIILSSPAQDIIKPCNFCQHEKKWDSIVVLMYCISFYMKRSNIFSYVYWCLLFLSTIPFSDLYVWPRWINFRNQKLMSNSSFILLMY